MAEKFTLKNTLELPLIASAGGLVCNTRHQVLLIFKRGMWDMPKGHVEAGDCPQESALREVHEETGLDSKRLSITGKLVSTYHTTTSRAGPRCLKKIHWYRMAYSGGDDPVQPQIEEGIIDCRWVAVSDLHRYRDQIITRASYVLDFWHNNFAYLP